MIQRFQTGPMIDIRSFEGTPADASAFIFGVWRRAYGGRAPIAVWTPEFFEWTLMSRVPQGTEYMMAAYDGPTLVGTVFAEAFTYRLRGAPFKGAGGSWLAVDPRYLGAGVAKSMWAEMRRRYLRDGIRSMFGFTYITKHADLGQKFWSRNANTEVVSRVPCWVRVIDHAATAAWEPERPLALLSSAIGLFQGKPRDPASRDGVRPYVSADLAGCLRALRAEGARADLFIDYEDERFATQLDYKGYPKTVVAGQGSAVEGFINYFPIASLGRTEMPTGIVDYLVVSELPYELQVRLLATALAQARDQGLAYLMVPHRSGLPIRALLKTGFNLVPPQFRLISMSPEDDFAIGRVRRSLVPLR